MKKFIITSFIFLFGMLSAQETANRFFYELTFKPKKDSVKLDKVMTILDVTKDRSIYRDFTNVAQDSLLKAEIELMQKTQTMKDLRKTVKTPKFSDKIKKFYPSMKIEYSDRIANGMRPLVIGYTEDLKFNWKISNEKQKIGEYKAQKATADFAGRTWTAWFCEDIPLQDGPYKFHGLPGLIVKIEDATGSYSWILKGNKKVQNYNEVTEIEKMTGTNEKITEYPRETFEKMMNNFKQDPLASSRPYLTPEVMSQRMPGSDKTVGDMVKEQEKMYKDFYSYINNPIELNSATTSAKKKKK